MAFVILSPAIWLMKKKTLPELTKGGMDGGLRAFQLSGDAVERPVGRATRQHRVGAPGLRREASRSCSFTVTTFR